MPTRESRAPREPPVQVVLVRRRCTEQRHDCVPDELLDRAAVALELGADVLVVAAELVRDVLGVELLGARGEADEVGEEDRDDLSLPAALRHAASLLRAGSGSLHRRAVDRQPLREERKLVAVDLRVEVVAGRIPAHHRSGRSSLLQRDERRPRHDLVPAAVLSITEPDAHAPASAAGRSVSATAEPEAGAQRAPGVGRDRQRAARHQHHCADARPRRRRSPRRRGRRGSSRRDRCASGRPAEASQQVDGPAHRDHVPAKICRSRANDCAFSPATGAPALLDGRVRSCRPRASLQPRRREEEPPPPSPEPCR